MWTALADKGKGGGHCDTAVTGHEHKRQLNTDTELSLQHFG